MWSLKDIVEYVTTTESQVSFSSYARTYIEKIDKPRTAKNYALIAPFVMQQVSNLISSYYSMLNKIDTSS